jgi:DNA-binding winged helix-turn-helix (wHTH) protein
VLTDRSTQPLPAYQAPWLRSGRPVLPQTVADQRVESFDAHAVAFGHCRFVTHSRELLVDGAPAPLGGRASEVLAVLIEASGKLVTKDDLLSRVWPMTTVGENCLQVQISSLRKALGDDRNLIKTVSGRGYRFVAQVTSEVPSTHSLAEGDASGHGRLLQLESENAWLRWAMAELMVDKLMLHHAQGDHPTWGETDTDQRVRPAISR